MRRHRVIAVTAMVCALWSIETAAQVEPPSDEEREIQNLIDTGHFVEAERRASVLLADTERIYGDESVQVASIINCTSQNLI